MHERKKSDGGADKHTDTITLKKVSVLVSLFFGGEGGGNQLHHKQE